MKHSEKRYKGLCVLCAGLLILCIALFLRMQWDRAIASGFRGRVTHMIDISTADLADRLLDCDYNLVFVESVLRFKAYSAFDETEGFEHLGTAMGRLAEEETYRALTGEDKRYLSEKLDQLYADEGDRAAICYELQQFLASK